MGNCSNINGARVTSNVFERWKNILAGNYRRQMSNTAVPWSAPPTTINPRTSVRTTFARVVHISRNRVRNNSTGAFRRTPCRDIYRLPPRALGRLVGLPATRCTRGDNRERGVPENGKFGESSFRLVSVRRRTWGRGKGRLIKRPTGVRRAVGDYWKMSGARVRNAGISRASRTCRWWSTR